MDYAKNGYRGISLKEAYTLLKGKKSKPVIVAVIDSGIDTLQEDLKPIFWHNPKEIPNNQIDEDKNGLVDDAIGWNYLGAPNGENLSISVSDIYRTYHRFKADFDNKKISEIPKEKQYLFNEWQRAKTLLMNSYKEAVNTIETVTENFTIVQKTNNYLTKYLKKTSFTQKDLITTASKKDSTGLCMQIWKNIFDGRDFTNETFIKDFENYKKELEENIRQVTTAPTDFRGQLLNDDSYDIAKKNYGNTNLQTHSGYHGTSVSSIIGAVRNNGKGIDGIADNVQIMMIRAILGKDEFDKDVALAIRYAVDNGAKVINMSFGKSIAPDKKWVDDAIQYALAKDVVLVHAAGNDAQNIDVDFNYPNGFYLDGSRMANFLNVGASGDYSTGGLVASFSNYGKKMVDIFAPGVDINCAIANNGTQLASGTSMASPVVAGIAALLRSYFPKLTAAQIVTIIKQSGTVIKENIVLPGTKDEKVAFNALSETGKIVNAFEAVKMAMAIK
jgi:subtilisin family serine protease